MVAQAYNAARFGVDLGAACPMLLKIQALCQDDPIMQASRPEAQPDAERK